MGLQPFYGKGPDQLLWPGSQAAHAEIISGMPNRLNYCVIFIVHTHLRNVAARHLIQPGRLQVGDP
jgi:hypothetical protein